MNQPQTATPADAATTYAVLQDVARHQANAEEFLGTLPQHPPVLRAKLRRMLEGDIDHLAYRLARTAGDLSAVADRLDGAVVDGERHPTVRALRALARRCSTLARLASEEAHRAAEEQRRLLQTYGETY